MTDTQRRVVTWPEFVEHFGGFTQARKAVYQYAYKGIIPLGTEEWDWEETAHICDNVNVSLTLAISELIETLNRRG